MQNIIFIILSLAVLSAQSQDKIPQTEISNGIINARLYLPDARKGYYRGARFDWSGVMPELSYKGHSYFGQWFPTYSPTLHDAIMGPVEAFVPIGYDNAKPGENFLIIGIGMITKPDESKYHFATPYQISNTGSWKVKKGTDQVEFTHKLNDKVYAYVYTKTVQLLKDKPEMVLLHTLKNTGKHTIETNVYNHNFFVMDNQPINQDYVITFPFNLESEDEGDVNLGKLDSNKVVYHKELSADEHLYYKSVQGFGSSASDYDVKIENHKTGAAVRITCDQPISKIVFWSAQKTVCPEPYIHIKVDPGETITWKISYQFYTCDTK